MTQPLGTESLRDGSDAGWCEGGFTEIKVLHLVLQLELGSGGCP